MAKQRAANIRQTSQLVVYNNLQAGWSAIFQPCVTEINRLLTAGGVGVQFQVGTNLSAANVVVGSGNGQITFSYQGQTYQRTFNGTQLHGATYQLSVSNLIQKAFIFVPANPRINTPRGMRNTGVMVMKAILLHEFVHACGLENSDHSSDDIFMGYPQTNPGSSPNQDRIGIHTSSGYTWFPPYFLAAGTRGKLSPLW